MKRSIAATLIFFCLFYYSASAQELMISDIQIAASVSDRKPVDADTTFPADIGKIYCYTQVKGAEDPAKIVHVWYYKDQEKARINLNVKSEDWRTWSSKSILDSWIGPWRVMVEDANGNVLTTKTFSVK